MFKYAQPFFLHVISPLHAGSGSEIGVIDLPIQRERHTGFPKIESSSLKGAIREVFEEKQDGKVDELVRIHKIFGYDESEKKEKVNEKFKEKEQKEFAGAIGFTDARLLLFPVKSMKGVFAYITCLHALKTFKQDLKLCQNNGISFDADLPEAKLFTPQNDQSVCLTADKDAVAIKEHVLLEEYAFKVNPTGTETAAALAKRLAELTGIEDIKQKLVIFSDVDFRDFVEMSTEVITRTKIDNTTGTVKPGHLFTEEFLPAESVLYSLVLGSPLFLKDDDKKGVFEPQPENSGAEKEAELVLKYFTGTLPGYMQIGGDATIGKGIVRTQVWREEL